MNQQRLAQRKQPKKASFLWSIAKRLNITSSVSKWLQVYKETFASVLAVPSRHWNGNYTVEAFHDSVEWRRLPESVELLGFLAVGAAENGHMESAQFVYKFGLQVIEQLKGVTHPSLAIGKILLNDYTLLSGLSEDCTLRNTGHEMIKTLFAINNDRNKKSICTRQQIEDLKIISVRLRMYTHNFMTDRVKELSNITQLGQDVSHMINTNNPSLSQALMIAWACSGRAYQVFFFFKQSGFLFGSKNLDWVAVFIECSTM